MEWSGFRVSVPLTFRISDTDFFSVFSSRCVTNEPGGWPSLPPGPSETCWQPFWMSLLCHSYQAPDLCRHVPKAPQTQNSELYPPVSVFRIETADARRNSGSYSNYVLCLSPRGHLSLRSVSSTSNASLASNSLLSLIFLLYFSNKVLPYILPLVFSFSNVSSTSPSRGVILRIYISLSNKY